MKKTIVVFGALIIAILVLFQIGKFSINSGSLKTEFILAAIAISFFFIGAFLFRKKSDSSTKEEKIIDKEKINKLGISDREYEVLQLIYKGLSNSEIANQLYVTESTIKTHVSNLLVKLNVKSRTQAIIKAKELQII